MSENAQVIQDGLVGVAHRGDGVVTKQFWLPTQSLMTGYAPATARWLKDELGIETLSVNERKKVRTPDSYVPSDGGTIEIKNPIGANYLTLRDHIERGLGQSRRVVVAPIRPGSMDEAKEVLSDALSRAGAHADAIVIRTEGGRYVVWNQN